MSNLYQPIRFKRWKQSKWEKGFLRTDKDGVTCLEKDLKTEIERVSKYEIDWSIKF